VCNSEAGTYPIGNFAHKCGVGVIHANHFNHD